MLRKRRVALIAVALSLVGTGPSRANPTLTEPTNVAVFDVRFFDTSNEPGDQSGDHARRAADATRLLREALDRSGNLRPVAPRLQACADDTPECVFSQTRSAGARQALTVVVQKSSSLIVQAWLRLTDIEQNRVLLARDVNFRGDNDESWRRAFGFLARDVLNNAR